MIGRQPGRSSEASVTDALYQRRYGPKSCSLNRKSGNWNADDRPRRSSPRQVSAIDGPRDRIGKPLTSAVTALTRPLHPGVLGDHELHRR